MCLVCRLDPDVLEALFGIQQATSKKETTRKPAVSDAPAVVAILDSRKAHNFSIQLRALGLTRREICAALLEGKFTQVEVYFVRSLYILNCRIIF